MTAARRTTFDTFEQLSSEMATTPRSTRRPLEGLYPPGQPPQPHRRGVIDDTLDVHPPYHLLRGKPTPEDMAAAKQLAAEHGYPLPHFPPEAQPSTAPETLPSNGAPARQSRRIAERKK